MPLRSRIDKREVDVDLFNARHLTGSIKTSNLLLELDLIS